MSQYKFKINGKQYDVTVNSIEGSNAAVTVNGTDYNVELAEPVAGAVSGGVVAPATAATLGTLRGETASAANGGVERSETVLE